MFTLYYTTVTQLVTLTVLTAVRPFGRLTGPDQDDYFVRLANTTLEERRRAAFTVRK